MKERLLGAAVLVIAAVVVIPALLDGPPREADPDTREIELPAADAPALRTHVVDLDDSSDATPATQSPAETQPAPEPGADDEPPLASAPLPQPSPVAPALPAVPDAAEARGWAVQVGSFSSETNARRLASLLSASDYPAFVVRNVVEGRVMYRVRVGPEPDRERAEALAERLREDRQQAQLVRHP